MLYWTETVIIAFWTILGITRLPTDQLGTITVGGREKPATHKLLCGYFTLVAGMFVLGHLGFLWFMFSGEWLKKVSGSSSILNALFVTDGVWLALIFMFVSAWISYLSSPPPDYPRPIAGAPPTTPAKDREAAAMQSASMSADSLSGSPSCRSRSSSAACSQDIRLDGAAPDRHRLQDPDRHERGNPRDAVIPGHRDSITS